jgi:hypothetical protein
MIGKTFWLLLLVALGIAGCAKPPDQSAAAGGQQSAQVGKAQGVDKLPAGVSRTPDMTAYHWPADFKLPLIIDIPLPEVPKEIQGPSPPIVEEEKQPTIEEEQKSPIDEKQKPPVEEENKPAVDENKSPIENENKPPIEEVKN